MSMPYEVIYCDQCQASWATFCVWGHFAYRLPNGDEVHVNRRLGWCTDCGSIRAIEELPSPEQLADEMSSAVRRHEDAQPKTLAERLFGVSRRTNLEHRTAAKQMRDANNLLKVLDLRTSGPRCLECGSTENFALPWPPITSTFSGRKFDVPLGANHPECGGNLRVKDSGGTSVALIFRPRIYDCEGLSVVDTPSPARSIPE